MNPLSILNSASRASGLKDEGFVSRDDAAQDDAGAQRGSFASMLNQPSPSQAAATQQARSQPAKREAPASQRDDEPAPSQDDAPRAQGQDERQARPQRAERNAGKERAPRESGDASETTTEATAAATEGAPQADATLGDPGSWPPPGLGGFGLMLLQPTATAATPDAAALAGPAANPLLASLPQADGAVTATAPNALPTGAIALPGLAGAATAPAAAGSGDAATLAALATAAAAGTSPGAAALTSDGAAPAIDSPTFALPTLAHTPAAARAQDAPAVFSASPTPTPNLHGDGFDEAVGTRLTWLAEQKIGHAHIKITPNDLGPVEVRLQMDGDKVHASFTAAHVETRQALEQSLPRLRDMLGEHGFQLAHADVGAQQQGQRNEGGATRTGFDGLADAAGEDTASVVVPASVLRARGLLDAYA